MKRLEVERQDLERLSLGAAARLVDAPTLIEEPTEIWLDGEMVAAYTFFDEAERVRQAVLPELLYPVDFYSHASGRSNGLSVTARTFGWLPRRGLRQNYCHRALLAVSYPELNEELERMAHAVNSYYHALLPNKYEEHKQMVAAVKPDYRIGDTVFTSGIVNKDSLLAYHVDGGNFVGSWSAQITFRNEVSGGHLAIPELGVTFGVANNSLLLFNGQAWKHGVTAFEKHRRDSYRYSVVFYAMRQLCNCGTPQEEMQRTKRIKRLQELKRAGLATERDIVEADQERLL